MLDHRPIDPADVLIKGAHVLDPRNELDATLDVLVRNGEIAAIGENLSSADAETIWNRRNTRPLRCGFARRSSHSAPTIAR